MDNKNVKLILSYDGSHYHGWQRQKNGITIQEIIEEKLQIILTAPVKLIASGRTDAGVHAVNQVCNFNTQSLLDPEAIRRGLNSLLPDDIYIKKAEHVPLEFHARYDAKRKIYEYRILNRKAPNIFKRRYLWHIQIPLNLEEMEKCLRTLKGIHDFSSFKSTGSNNTNPVRSVSRAEIQGPDENHIIRIEMEADGFLRHMVRNIVGTIVAVGLGKINSNSFREILESKDRRNAGIKAPAQGLFLIRVLY